MTGPAPAHFSRMAAAAAAVAIFAAACGGGTTRPSACGAGPRLLPTAPSALPTLDAQGFQDLLCQLRGKPVVVNIWASWCGPCIFEAPELAVVGAAYTGVAQFVGVDIQDQRNPGRAFIERFGWTYPSVFDPQGAIRDSFGLVGAPHTLFFDAHGERTFVWSGPVTQDVLVSGINGALRHGGGSASPTPADS